MESTKKVLEDGTIEYKNSKGKLHREDGPAVEWSSGDKVWYLNGQLHREDGPAYERPDGTREFWLNGEGPLEPLVWFTLVQELRLKKKKKTKR